MAGKTFTCEDCGGTFDADWTEEEAVAEAVQTFPGQDVADMAPVCDHCYEEILDRHYLKQWMS